MWILRVTLFGFDFNFCFHYLKLTQMSYGLVAFFVIPLINGSTVSLPATLLPQRLSLRTYQTSHSFMTLFPILFHFSPYPPVHEFNKPSTWITIFFTLMKTKNGIQMKNFNIQTLEKNTANTNRRIQHQLSLPHMLYKFATHKQGLWVFQFWGYLIFTNKIRIKDRFD